MRRRNLFLFYFFLLVCSVAGHAQGTMDTVVAVPPPVDDSMAGVDTAMAPQTEEEEDASEMGDRLISQWFTVKADERVVDDPSVLVLRTVPDSVVVRMRGSDDFWYVTVGKGMAKDAGNKKKGQNDRVNRVADKMEKFATSEGFSNVLWAIMIAAMLGLLIWFLAKMNPTLFHRRQRFIAAVGQGLEEEDIFSVDFHAQVERAWAKEQYRTAIRLLFLQTLRMMSERELIHYLPDKTNQAYANELYNTAYYDSFRRLVRYYEYAWYGEFDLPQSNWQQLRTEYEQFQQQLKG